MNRLNKIENIRAKLRSAKESVGTWMQIPDSSIAEILGNSGYDWVAIDLEHGSVCVHQLPNIFRAIELGNTLPLARLANGYAKECKQVLDAGAGGIIVPMIESAEQLIQVRDACCWPPAGKRGIGFSRANLFGKHFEDYTKEAQSPLLVAMIENISAIENLEEILTVDGLDAIFIGPYDLSASMGLTAGFEDPEFISCMKIICEKSKEYKVPYGIHIVKPDSNKLKQSIEEGYQFIAYSTDSVILSEYAALPINLEN